jgi:hypothetical protein
MNAMNKYFLGVLTASILILTACSKGGNTDTTTPAPNPVTNPPGNTDAPVETNAVNATYTPAFFSLWSVLSPHH